MSKEMKEKIEQNKEKFLQQIAEEERELLEEDLAGGVMKDSTTNFGCDSGC